MTGLDLGKTTITELSESLRTRAISPVEVIQATLDRIERLDPQLLSFTTVTPDYALARARQAEAEIMAGNFRGPMHGIPYTLKDVIATAGVRTTYGHPKLIDFKPQQHATLHTLLEEAGGILVGKVYSQIGRGESQIMCHNPWDTTLSPGTSSCGSGAAVAASLGLLSIGTDTGGSVRHPASNCGLVGMRATFGRVSRFGVVSSSWHCDQAGPLTKSVEDNAIALSVLGTYDPLDPISINEPDVDYRARIADGIHGLRIGVPVDRWIWDQDHEEAEQIIRQAIDLLRDLGAEIHEISLPEAEQSGPQMLAITRPLAAVWWTENFSEEVIAGWPEIQPAIEAGKKQTFAEYLHGLRAAATIKQELIAAFKNVDIIAMPTGSTLNDRLDTRTTMLRGKEVPWRFRALGLNAIASITGVPALTVPCGFAFDDRLPVGLMLHASPMQEAVLYRAAYAYEQATDWHLRQPPMTLVAGAS